MCLLTNCCCPCWPLLWKVMNMRELSCICKMASSFQVFFLSSCPPTQRRICRPSLESTLADVVCADTEASCWGVRVSACAAIWVFHHGSWNSTVPIPFLSDTVEEPHWVLFSATFNKLEFFNSQRPGRWWMVVKIECCSSYFFLKNKPRNAFCFSYFLETDHLQQWKVSYTPSFEELVG